MSTQEQPGPPSTRERERANMEWLRVSQLRYVEGYKSRMAQPHPMKKGRDGKETTQREPRWSFEEAASTLCPAGMPAHECERWMAGFLLADKLASDQGTAAMERGDPSRPPPRPKRAPVAVQEDGLLELAPPMEKKEAREWWDRQHGKASGFAYRDAGEQK